VAAPSSVSGPPIGASYQPTILPASLPWLSLPPAPPTRALIMRNGRHARFLLLGAFVLLLGPALSWSLAQLGRLPPLGDAPPPAPPERPWEGHKPAEPELKLTKSRLDFSGEIVDQGENRHMGLRKYHLYTIRMEQGKIYQIDLVSKTYPIA